MKNENGKSIIIWILSVVMIALLIIFAIHFLENMVTKESQKDIKTEMLQVQAKAKLVLENHHVNEANGLKGEKIEEESLLESFGVEKGETYYKWTKDTLQEVGMKEMVLKQEDYYLVNYDTEEVIYSAGYQTKEGKTYYKLSEIKEVE